MLGKLIYFAISGGQRFIRERYDEGSVNLDSLFPGRGFARVNRNLLARMIAEDPRGRFQSMEHVIAAIDELLPQTLGANSDSRISAAELDVIAATLSMSKSGLKVSVAKVRHKHGQEIDQLVIMDGATRHEIDALDGDGKSRGLTSILAIAQEVVRASP